MHWYFRTEILFFTRTIILGIYSVISTVVMVHKRTGRGVVALAMGIRSRPVVMARRVGASAGGRAAATGGRGRIAPLRGRAAAAAAAGGRVIAGDHVSDLLTIGVARLAILADPVPWVVVGSCRDERGYTYEVVAMVMVLAGAALAEAHEGCLRAPAEATLVACDIGLRGGTDKFACRGRVLKNNLLHGFELGARSLGQIRLRRRFARNELVALLAVAGNRRGYGVKVGAVGILFVAAFCRKLDIANSDQQVTAVLPSVAVVKGQAGAEELARGLVAGEEIFHGGGDRRRCGCFRSDCCRCCCCCRCSRILLPVLSQQKVQGAGWPLVHGVADGVFDEVPSVCR